MTIYRLKRDRWLWPLARRAKLSILVFELALATLMTVALFLPWPCAAGVFVVSAGCLWVFLVEIEESRRRLDNWDLLVTWLPDGQIQDEWIEVPVARMRPR